MEELSPLSPHPAEITVALIAVLAPLTVLVASYRRSRCLFDRTQQESVAIAAVSAIFWPFWVIGSLITWRAISARWAEHRRARRSPVAVP
ncbi:hypothetical protein IFT73_04645 [Aeromicrobium sp. CFBP 8757]|uniref:hypothetical protein n=1 Tax=Aeromicrobium sp. CFBP 8757 TaxID=2775288 RepID=UPI00177D0026|nr:hypothetical protein [Aeromicrobium sp. CFBP 8757]MBD8606131.1 hypothetical protein [Aeromicrobium sp. CFBP 8757]